MFSSARKLGVVCCILAAFNILGLIMVTMLIIGAGLNFTWIFTILLYAITLTIIGLLLTFAIRGLAQDSELEAASTAAQIRKLTERIHELESKLK